MSLVKHEDAALIKRAQSSYKPHVRPKIVLEEDEYIDGLSNVIKHNFFPDLVNQDEKAPALSLERYQSKYTSEDNASFLDILDSHNLRTRASFAWHYNGNKVYSENVKHHDRRIAGEREQGLLDDRPAVPDGWHVTPKNALMFDPDALDSSQQSQRSNVKYAATRMPAEITYPAAVVTEVDELAEPTVNGFTFVDEDEPTTTPKRNPFTIPATPARDELLDRLTRKPSRRPSTPILSALKTPKFKSSPRLSPAATRLRSTLRQPSNLRHG